MTTEIVKINASDYGLEETKAQEIKAMFVPMLNKMDELEVQYNDILKRPIDPETCQMASDLRKSYVKTRTGTDEIHKKLKAFYLNGGRFVDAFKNAQLFASGEKEKTLKAIEDHFENQEKERLEKLRTDRVELLKPYTEIEPLALGHMEQAVFDNYLIGVKLAHEQRIAAEKKAEEDRIAKEKEEAEAREKQRLENIRLKEEADKREREIEAEREKIRKENEEKERLAEIERQIKAKRNEELKPYIIFIRDYSKMLSLDEKAYQKELAGIKRGAKEHYEYEAQQKAKADKERADLLAKAEIERKEKERLEKEIADKKAADEKKKQTEIKAQKDAEKKAKLASDKDKLLNFMQLINDLPRPDVKNIEAAEIVSQVNGLLVKVSNFIKERADKL